MLNTGTCLHNLQMQPSYTIFTAHINRILWLSSILCNNMHCIFHLCVLCLHLTYNDSEMFLTDADSGKTANISKTLADVDTETKKKGMSTNSVNTGEQLLFCARRHTD